MLLSGNSREYMDLPLNSKLEHFTSNLENPTAISYGRVSSARIVFHLLPNRASRQIFGALIS